MDGTQGGGNNQNNGEKKAQLSWSQPVTTPTQKTNTPENQVSKTPAASAQTLVPEKNNTFRNAAITVLLLAAVAIVASVIMSQKNNDAKTNTPASTGATTTPSTIGQAVSSTSTDGTLSIASPQPAGLQVAVANVVVDIPTWVVVYENRGGLPGNVLGAALFVSGRTSGTVDLLRGTLPGQTYFVGEARDDGDHMFSMVNDPAVRAASGTPVWVQFETK